MKIMLTRQESAGFKGPRTQVKVIELAEGEVVPPGAETVPDVTEVHDWKDQENAAP